MGADLSRVRFDARRDITKVVQQQGRVLLDADGNEQTDALDRRLRAQSADLGSFGLDPDVAGTAVVPRTTPDAFRLTMTSGELSLGRGRMYVDGLLAENHGTGPDELDPLLGGLRGTDATPYLEQPYWPTPDPLPTTGRHLVYLEVRERELTWVEDPGLIDPGIALDTTARAQVVWQVKVHAADVPGLACDTPDDDIPGWTDVIAPPASRLTVGTETVPAADDFCSLPPSGDYRGLENQTYRVEVHDGGPAGTATFKWSRDNGSVTVPVSEWTSSSRLRLASLGKDTHSLGLRDGQWVEVLDDVHELAGRPGELRQISVDTGDRSISFAPPLPAADWPSTTSAALAVHLRVRRWDGDTGATTIPAGVTAVGLEHGITATLTAGGGEFRTGEHWVFAARTATTSVEELQDAPPLGPHRHFARLGIIEGGTVVSDQCPPLWPPEGGGGEDCACTVCVSVEDHASGTFTIQAALEQVREDGGTVCLEVGTYRLLKPLLLRDGTAVRLRGQGPATLVIADDLALAVESSTATSVADLTIYSGDVDVDRDDGTAGAAIRLTDTMLTSLTGLEVRIGGSSDEKCAVAVADMTAGLTVRDCLLRGPVGVRLDAARSAPTVLFDIVVTDTRFSCTAAAARSAPGVLYAHRVRFRDNVVDGAGFDLEGEVARSDALLVLDNHVQTAGNGVAAPAGARVAGNSLVGDIVLGPDGDVSKEDYAVGVWIQPSDLPWPQPRTEVCENTLTGFVDGIVVAGAAPTQVTGNDVGRCVTGIGYAAFMPPAADVAVTDNLVRDLDGLRDAGAVHGISVASAATVLVAGNTLRSLGATGATTSTRGISVTGADSCRLSGNVVQDVSIPDGAGDIVDFNVQNCVTVTVTGNQSHATASSRLPQAAGLVVDTWNPFIIDPGRFEPFVSALAGRHHIAVAEDRLLVRPVLPLSIALADIDRTVTISDNVLVGGQDRPALRVGELSRGRVGAGNQWSGAVLVSHNRCQCPKGLGGGAVQVNARSATLTGNHVQGGEPSIEIEVAQGPRQQQLAAVLNNTASSEIHLHGFPLNPPWNELNLEGVGP